MDKPTVDFDRLFAEAPEIAAAVGWWAAKLGDGEHDAGDPAINAESRYACAVGRPVTDEQRATFARELKEAVRREWSRGFADWRPEEPEWAGTFRVLLVDYGAAGPLAEALRAAGLGTVLTLPIKTCMQIDPGLVRVRHGYRAASVTIYEGEPVAYPSGVASAQPERRGIGL